MQPNGPAYFLRGVTYVEGIPVVRSLEEQKRTQLPHLMVYPDGRVKICIRSTVARDWDPNIPLRKQLSIARSNAGEKEV